MSDVGMEAVLAGVSVDEAVDRITAALGEHGWGVLTSIDIKATFKAKLDLDVDSYRILGACQPQLAHKALAQDPDVGLLMPCNVIVFETKAGAAVRVIKPTALVPLAQTETTKQVMVEAEALLEKALASLAA